MKHNISIKEIAALSGVSIATVSRVINQLGGYSEETEARVKNIIEQYQYTPNLVAKGLREMKSPTIGILVPDITNEHFSKIVLELQNFFYEHGYLTLIFNSNESKELEKKYLRSLAGQRVSGIVLFSGIETNLKPKGIPAVYVGREPHTDADEDIVFIESNDLEGGYLATQELIDKGCKRIAFLTDNLKGSSKAARYQGYCSALTEAGLKVDRALVFNSGSTSPEAAGSQITKEIAQGLEFDGLVCVNDMLAVGSIDALQKMNIRIPEDVKVTGYDDISLSGYYKIPVTTVHQYTDKIAEMVSDALLKLIEGETIRREKYTIPVTLIRRESSRAT